MYKELQANALVDNFKDKLKSMNFIEEGKRQEIEAQLAIIANPEEHRYKVIGAAKWLWKVFIECSLRDITDNMRGLRELCEYFDDYADYENVLFALDDNHRDHVIHSIWVMLIGFYLRVNYKPLKVLEYGGVTTLGNDDKERACREEMITRIKEHEDSLWCMIALTHDLGYPIEKTKKANQKMGEMIRHFGFLEQRDFSYNFSVIHQTAIEALINNLSSVLICMSDKRYNIVRYMGTRLDFSRSLERLDHGIMSAYLLQMYLDYICDSLQYIEGLPLPWGSENKELAEGMAIVFELMSSIAAHSNVNMYSTKPNTSSSVLSLSDELDEFSRYSRSGVSGDWTRTMCRTELECTNKSVRIRYTFDKYEIEDRIEDFFIAKVRGTYQRFELRTGDIERFSLTCRDVRKASPIEWYFEKSLPKNREGVVIDPEGKRQDVHEMVKIS